MRLIPSGTLLLAPLLFAGSGCKNREFNQSNTNAVVSTDGQRMADSVRKILGGPLVGDQASTWDWRSITHEESSKYIRNIFENQSIMFLPEAHPATQRLNAILARFHEGVIAHFPEAARVPVPKAIVLLDPNIEAMVIPAPICFNAEVRTHGSSPSAPLEDAIIWDLHRSVGMANPSMCIDVNSNTQLLASAVADFARNNPKCNAKLQGNAVWIDGQCLDIPEIPPEGLKFKHFAVPSITNRIGVHSQLLKTLREEKTTGALAHELGHYYRRHAIAASRNPEMDVPYRVSVYKSAPMIPSSAYDDQVAELAAKMAASRDIPYEIRIPDLKFSGLELSYIADAVVGLFGSEPIAKAIPALAQTAKKTCLADANILRIKAKSGMLQSRNLDDIRFINAVAPKMEKCLDLLGQVSVKQLRAAGVSPWRIAMATPKDLAGQVSSADNMKERVLFTVEELRKARTLVESLVKQASQAGIGVYTTEVEADVLAPALLSFGGFNPSAFQDTLFSLFGLVGSAEGYFAPSMDECRKGYMNNWQHWLFNGKPFVPFFGTPGDLYPSNCFRIYNVDSEVKARKYVPVGQRLPPLPGWDGIMQGL